MMKKRLLAYILILSSLLCLTACGGEEPEAPAEDPVENEEPVVQEPEEPEIYPAEGGEVRRIDLDFLDDQELTVSNVFAASDDILLVFASRLQNGTVSEEVQLFKYSISRECFTGDSTPIGVVGQYPDIVFDDGTVSTLTINTENYTFKDLLFIRPDNLSCETVDITAFGEARSIHVSPDKTKVAISDNSRLYITDMSFENTIAEFPGYVPEDGDETFDFHLPTAYAWTSDGNAVFGGMLGWEWVYNPLSLTVDGEFVEYTQHEYLAGLPIGRHGLLLYDFFDLRPSGVYDFTDESFVPFAFTEDLPGQDDMEYISALTVQQDREIVAIGVTLFGEDKGCRAVFYKDGERLLSFSLPSDSEYPPGFENISLSPSGKLAAMMTCATVDQPKAIYYTLLGE